jgi:DNA replication protein DnaC
VTAPLKPCPRCGAPNLPIEVDAGPALGVLTVAAMCSPCLRAEEEERVDRNHAELAAMVREQCEIPFEFADCTIASHPDPHAREIGTTYVATVPNPLPDLLAKRTWSRGTPERRAELAFLQRAALRDHRGIGLYGQQGRGKSGLYAAIAHELEHRGVGVVIANVSLLLQQLREARADGPATKQILAPLLNTAYLVFDDLDKMSNATFDGRPTADAQRSFHALFSVLQHRLEQRLPVGVTANRSLQRLKVEVFEPFGDDGLAFCDRFLRTTGAWYELSSPRSFRASVPL